jgi:Zn-dependent peptidase ImmA (M78 family)
MTFRVPYIAEDVIEGDAEALLGEYARARNIEIRPPIPIENIVEKHLKLRFEFNDLHKLFGIPRSGISEGPDIFGAIWLHTGEIVIDESLDPEERPELEGRFRFTLAHEAGGHWRLHRSFAQRDRDQGSLFGDAFHPTVVCRSSQAKSPVEWQADFYASCLLMPRWWVHAEWRDRVGRTKPLLVSELQPNPRVLKRAERLICWQGKGEAEAVEDALLEDVAEPMARRFNVSRSAMRVRLEHLGLMLRREPAQRSLLGIW